MNNDLTMQVLAMNTVATQNSVQLAVIKKASDMQASLLNTMTQAALSPPAPPGQGLEVDKRA